MHATVRDVMATNVAAAGKDWPAVLEGGHMYLYPALSVSPYPNSAVSAWQLAIIAVVPVLALAAWLIAVFVAARQPQRRGAAGITPLPQQPPAQHQHREEPERKAA